MGAISDKVLEIVSPIIEEKGLELVDVEYIKEGSDTFLRIFIHHPDGIGHHHCATISEEVNTLLDLYEIVPESYILEVSSPGLERPLKKEEDYRRFIGERVKIKSFGPIHGKKEWQGQLLKFEEGVVHFLYEDEELEIPINMIASARLMVEF